MNCSCTRISHILGNHLCNKHADFHNGIKKVSNSHSSVLISQKISIEINQANHEKNGVDISVDNYDNDEICISNLYDISLNNNFNSAIENFIQILLEGELKLEYHLRPLNLFQPIL